MTTKKRTTRRPGKKAAGRAVSKTRRKAPAGRRKAAKPAGPPSRGVARPPRAAARRQTGRGASRRVGAGPTVARPEARKAQPRLAPSKPLKARIKPASPRAQGLKAMLESKQAEIVKQIKRARADSLNVDHTSFPEVGDLVSASIEKEKAFEYSEAGVNALREIAGALEKLKEGTYGICERCGKPIGVKRLEAMPSARLCVKCKIREEATSKIAPPLADNLFED